MNTEDCDFDPYAECGDTDYQASKSWLFRRLGLKDEFQEDFACLNGDRDRVLEFVGFYFGDPDLAGWRRVLCADLTVMSALDLIEPEPVDNPHAGIR